MHQHLHNSMHFLYKQEEATYEDLLSATLEAETEWMESKISVRVKTVNVKEHKEEVTTEFKSKIDSLTAILKSSTFGTSKSQRKEKITQGKIKQVDKGTVNPPLILH